jgi:hypothetical protein
LLCRVFATDKAFEEGRIYLFIHLPIEDGEHRWCLWPPDQAGFDFSACPITNVAVVRPLPDQLAVFEGAIDARTEELKEFLWIGPARASAVVSSDSPDESIDA